MDIKGKCEIIKTYTLIFKITNNIEKIRKKHKITGFFKVWGPLKTRNNKKNHTQNELKTYDTKLAI